MRGETLETPRTGTGDVKLTAEGVKRLREAFPYPEDESWVIKLAHEQGWQEANRSYLAWHRERGCFEMAALMSELGLTAVSSPRQAGQLVALAYEIFMPAGEFRGRVEQLSETKIRVVADVCPTYEKIEKGGWHGVTACSCWHHREGWYDAMGIDTVDTLIAEQKWGEPACVAEVEFHVAEAEGEA